MSIFQNTRKPEGAMGKITVSSMNLFHSPISKWGLKHIEIKPDDAILDIGCGGGMNIKRILKKCPEGVVIGIDFSPVSVEKSIDLNAKAIKDGKCTIVEGSVMSLPFRNDSFDIVTAFETIYFWPDLGKAFEQISHILKSGGTFMICNELSGENKHDGMWTDMIDGMNIYSPSHIRALLLKVGFSSVRAWKNNWGCICIKAVK